MKQSIFDWQVEAIAMPSINYIKSIFASWGGPLLLGGVIGAVTVYVVKLPGDVELPKDSATITATVIGCISSISSALIIMRVNAYREGRAVAEYYIRCTCGLLAKIKPLQKSMENLKLKVSGKQGEISENRMAWSDVRRRIEDCAASLDHTKSGMEHIKASLSKMTPLSMMCTNKMARYRFRLNKHLDELKERANNVGVIDYGGDIEESHIANISKINIDTLHEIKSICKDYGISEKN